MDEIIYLYNDKYYKMVEVEKPTKSTKVPPDYDRRMKQFMNRLPGIPAQMKAKVVALARDAFSKPYNGTKQKEYEVFLDWLEQRLKNAKLPHDRAKPSKTAFEKIIKEWNTYPIPSGE